MTGPIAADSYGQFLADLKGRIQTAQLRASLAINRELVLLYWQLGRDILDRQERESWGAKVIDRLATDLKRAFPDMKGFSPRNLKYMRAFAEAWRDEAFCASGACTSHVVSQPRNPRKAHVARRPDLVCQCRRHPARLEPQRPRSSDWSGPYAPPGKGGCQLRAHPACASIRLAQHITKDPYNFDFLTLGDDARERDLERGLLDHLRQFLLELGVGFAFIGSQYRLPVGNRDFFIDLLFYHLKLRAYVVIDLKMKAFEPEFAGKMNFYLSAVNDLLRHPDDQPSIGIILCKTKERIIAEYALRDINQPIGISEYRPAESLPEKLQGSLPSIEELETELGGEIENAEERKSPQNWAAQRALLNRWKSCLH
jgi:predicted nuclease of restriction endonuclease-like (RecB) superfamily